eukprot:TRINITY_DN8361_c0_g1_i1.p3 TRINITY_DN8361_c0_g1~~TRINITY_DN8361_c0_g1_i1.p3  ORF type:complete len:184 (-),score=20.07 TRINITY_DN8361_c0_g1_i1:45-596(-)
MIYSQNFFKFCCILVLNCIVIKASGKQQKQKSGECECEDISPPGNFTCEDQKRFDKCRREWMTDKGYCALSCGRCNCLDDQFIPQIENSDNSSSKSDISRSKDTFKIVSTKPQASDILARDLSPEPEQEYFIYSEEDQQLGINDTQLLTLQKQQQLVNNNKQIQEKRRDNDNVIVVFLLFFIL